MKEKTEVTFDEIKTWKSDSYAFLDVREESAVAYGKIPGAITIPLEELERKYSQLDIHKTQIVYCTKGIISMEAVTFLRENGYHAVSLKGGYYSFLAAKMNEEDKSEQDRLERIEKSIRKKFHKELFSKFAKAINTYELVQENDHIAVCISGGKDSMLMAKLFQELKRHNKFAFELTFLVMDPGYSKENRQAIERNAKLMNIPITIFESNIFNTVDVIEKSPCYLCARMRRGYLYSKAKELGCNKIALGHHYDDVIETILMGMLYGGQVQTMMPKLHSSNFEGMELIRPLYLIREKDIIHWRDYNDLYFLQCACHFTDTCSSCRDDGTSASKRLEIKKLIASLKEVNPFVESNIFKSVENVNLDTIITYKEKGVRHSFLEHYDES